MGLYTDWCSIQKENESHYLDNISLWCFYLRKIIMNYSSNLKVSGRTSFLNAVNVKDIKTMSGSEICFWCPHLASVLKSSRNWLHTFTTASHDPPHFCFSCPFTTNKSNPKTTRLHSPNQSPTTRISLLLLAP